MSTEETRSTRSSRKTRSKEAKWIKRSMFKEHKDEIKQMLEEHKDEIKRMLEEHKDELKDEMSGMQKQWKKLNKQLNGSSGDVSPAPRSEPDQMKLPKFRLRITSKVNDKVVKGESILTEDGDLINIDLCDGGDKVIADNNPLASASVKMFVLDGEFNKGDTKNNWPKEDFEKSILKPVLIFNLAGGRCSIKDAKILKNSSNKKVRLGVMVMPQTKEVLEGLSNPFYVRDPPKKSKPAPVGGSSTPGNNTEQATGSSKPGNSTHGANLQCPQQPSSYTGIGMDIEPEPAPVGGSSTPGNNTKQATGLSTPGNSTHGANLQCPVQPLQQPSTGIEMDIDFIQQQPSTGIEMHIEPGVHSPTFSDLLRSIPPCSPGSPGSPGVHSPTISDLLRSIPPCSPGSPGVHSPTISNIRKTPMYSPPTGLGDFVADSEHMSMLRPVQPVSDWPAGGLHSSPISDLMSEPVYSPTGGVMEQFLTPLPAPVDDSSTLGNNTEQATRSSTPGNSCVAGPRPDLRPAQPWSLIGLSTSMSRSAFMCNFDLGPRAIAPEARGPASPLPGNSTHGARLQWQQQPSSYTEVGHFPATTDNMDPLPYDPNGENESTWKIWGG